MPVHCKPTIKYAKRPTEYANLPLSGGTLKNDKAMVIPFLPSRHTTTYRYVNDITSKSNIPYLIHEDLQISLDIPFNIDDIFYLYPQSSKPGWRDLYMQLH